MIKPEFGMMVRNKECIERFDSFLLDPGHIGVVTEVGDDLVHVRMKDFIPGCEEWDNEIILSSDEFGDWGNGIVIKDMTELFSYYFEKV